METSYNGTAHARDWHPATRLEDSCFKYVYHFVTVQWPLFWLNCLPQVCHRHLILVFFPGFVMAVLLNKDNNCDLHWLRKKRGIFANKKCAR